MSFWAGQEDSKNVQFIFKLYLRGKKLWWRACGLGCLRNVLNSPLSGVVPYEVRKFIRCFACTGVTLSKCSDFNENCLKLFLRCQESWKIRMPHVRCKGPLHLWGQRSALYYTLIWPAIDPSNCCNMTLQQTGILFCLNRAFGNHFHSWKCLKNSYSHGVIIRVWSCISFNPNVSQLYIVYQ